MTWEEALGGSVKNMAGKGERPVFEDCKVGGGREGTVAAEVPPCLEPKVGVSTCGCLLSTGIAMEIPVDLPVGDIMVMASSHIQT